MSTNPDNAVGTNGAFGGRTSVNAFNDGIAAYSRGVLSGWACEPSTGMKVTIGGDGSTRDVAIAEDNVGNKTTIDNIGGSPIELTISAAPATNSRIDAIVAYVDNPPQGDSTEVDNFSACGLIVVDGTAASTPVAPDDTAIRTAITADGASGVTAYYAVLAHVTVASGTTDIDASMITNGGFAGLDAKNIDFSTLNNNLFPISNGATNNNNVNSDTWYTQYTYNVPIDGCYFFAFSQRLSNGNNGYDFQLHILKNSTEINMAKTGGSSWVNYILGTVIAVVRCNKGDTIKFESRGGGAGVFNTLDGHYSLARIF